jgi:hypothetical protein
MKLIVATPDQIAERTVSRWGDLQRDETLFDLIRAEVTARSSCARWTVLQRLEHAVGGEAEHCRARLRELCDVLEYEGDVSASSGGVLHISPLRAIRLDSSSHRLICSLPCHRLRPLLPGDLVVEGVRRIHRFAPSAVAEAESAVQSVGGVVLSPEAWAGLDLAPIAGPVWLSGLDQRLQWEPESGGSLERDGALDWQCLVLSDDGPRWRRRADEPSRLWRARTSFARWVWAWTEPGQTPPSAAFVSLMADEASRTLFAVAREVERPVPASVVRDDASAHLRLREWLPRAEYRYLASLAAPVRAEKHQQWSIPLSRADDVLDTLCRRLGLDLKEEAPA